MYQVNFIIIVIIILIFIIVIFNYFYLKHYFKPKIINLIN